MTRKVTVIDYGSGNLLSISRGLEESGGTVELTGDADRIAEAERLVLPGVGAFGKAMEQLRARGLVQPVLDFIAGGGRFLGICVGMQMLMDYSEEFGRHEGLGVIAGHVAAIPATDAQGAPHPVPHIGWNALKAAGDGWRDSILGRLEPGAAAYFVHSFQALPKSADDVLAVCDYNGRSVTAAIAKGAVTGVQFHPEKSGRVGLGILESFLA